MIGKKMLMSLPIERFEVVSNVGDLTKARVKVYHLGANPNGTFFERSCIENSRDSFNYKPIVCDFNSNETDFQRRTAGSHHYFDEIFKTIRSEHRR